MLRDVKRRKLAFEYADERLRINAIRKNTILPRELQVLGASPPAAPAATSLGRSRGVTDARVPLMSTESRHIAPLLLASAFWGCLQQWFNSPDQRFCVLGCGCSVFVLNRCFSCKQHL